MGIFHDEVIEHRMPNINAALGCAQLEILNERLKEGCFIQII